MNLVISRKIEQKLALKHNVSRHEIVECFANREGNFLIDDREEHDTDPKTHWFIAETNYGRKLRIYFVPKTNDDGDLDIFIKTALEPKQHHIDHYDNA